MDNETRKNGEPILAIKRQIIITIFEGGKFEVKGPLDDLVTFYGMLNVAGDVARAEYQRLNAGRIITPMLQQIGKPS
jgi:hypothetical protein